MAYDKLFKALLGASVAHAEASRVIFHKFGLTDGLPKILYILNRNDGDIQKDLAYRCGVRPSTLSILLNHLEVRKLIKKESSSVLGKNVNRIYLTEKGRILAGDLDIEIDKLEEQGFAGFSKEERELTLQLLERVIKNHNRGKKGEL